MFTRLQGGLNLQVCLLNDSSSSDKDSDAEDSRTETSLDTPLSPLVLGCVSLSVWVLYAVIALVWVSNVS